MDGDFRVSGELLAGYILVCILLLPIVPHLRLLFHESHTMPSVTHPSPEDLATVLIPPILAVGLFAMGLAIRLALPVGSGENLALPRGVPAMLLTWWIAGPLLAFALTKTSAPPIFVPRYISYSALGFALLLTYAAWTIFGAKTGRVWALLSILLVTGNPLHLASIRQPGLTELGPAMRMIHEESKDPADLPPVMAGSDLVESNYYNWEAGNTPGGYLFAPFAAYPIKNRLLPPLHARLTEPVRDHIVQLLEGSLKYRDKVIVLTHDRTWPAPGWINILSRPGL